MNDLAKMALTSFVTAATVCSGWLLYQRFQEPERKVSAPITGNPTPPPTPTATKEDSPESQPDHWKMTFSDEFQGNRLDAKRWIDSYPGGVRTHTNNELQYYAPDAVAVDNDLITFTARRRSMKGKPYTSGMISSYGRFSQRFGWFEIRARFPKGQGIWPAFWLLPDNRSWPPEIDILEILGHEPDRIYFSNHWGETQSGHRYETMKYKGPDFSQDFHTVALHWKSDELIWYVDGVVRARTRQRVPQTPMFVLANLAVGGDWPGMPDATTPFPGKMEIDYIRVYQRTDH